MPVDQDVDYKPYLEKTTSPAATKAGWLQLLQEIEQRPGWVLRRDYVSDNHPRISLTAIKSTDSPVRNRTAAFRVLLSEGWPVECFDTGSRGSSRVSLPGARARLERGWWT